VLRATKQAAFTHDCFIFRACQTVRLGTFYANNVNSFVLFSALRGTKYYGTAAAGDVETFTATFTGLRKNFGYPIQSTASLRTTYLLLAP
jgi:hypothetical protein